MQERLLWKVVCRGSDKGLGAREKQQSRNYNGLGEHMPPVLFKMQKHQKPWICWNASLRQLSVLKALITKSKV